MIWLWRKDSNLRMAALTVRCLTNLATPQEWSLDFGLGTLSDVPQRSHFDLEAMKGVEPLSSGLQDRRSVIQLSYIAERGALNFVLCA